MSSLITQCPHCQTRFRVSGAQLQVARGMVRCGACMEVFDATLHFVIEQERPSATADERLATRAGIRDKALDQPRPAPPPSVPLKQEQDDPLWIHDDLDLDSLDLDEELSRLAREEVQRLEAAQPGRTSRRPGPTANTHAPKVDDERWAEALLAAELGEQIPPDGPPTEQPSGTEEATHRREPRLGRAEPPLDSDESRDPPMRLVPAIEVEQPLEIEDEPLRLQSDRHAGMTWRSLLLGVLTLIAALGLLAQYVVYHFDELARQETYRPWFETICPTLGCDVPARVDIGQIKSSNLVVRSHPEFAGALTVDAILYNRAPFAQPFPLLELRFADINGTLVASRQFKPAEYLAGELAGETLMPPQVPIHIALDILDPGKNAVNYSLSFQSPD